MSDLFETDTRPPLKEDDRFDWINLFAKEKLGTPDGWRWFSWTRKNFDTAHEFLLVRGAVCTAKIERGKRRGQDNWKLRDKSTETEHAIRRGELEAFQKEWSVRTGKCFECYGTGEAWAGWSSKDGNRYRPCHHCNASGTAKIAA